MKKKITEETVIFASVVKWVLLATVVGIFTGIASSGFVRLLDYSISFQAGFPYYYMFLPLILPCVAYLSIKVFPSSLDYTTDKVISVIHGGRKISLVSIIKAFFLSIISIASGGSAGKEAPCADIGAGFGSLFSAIFKFNTVDRKKLMICGVSAGFAGVFGVPVSGAIFGVEVLFVGSILYDVFLPSLVAGVTSYQVSSALGAKYFVEPLNFVPHFSNLFFLKIIIAGVFFGICSFAFIEINRFVKHLSSKFSGSVIIRAFFGGIILCLIGFLISPEYLSLGMNTVENSLRGCEAPFYAPIIKTITTAVTLAFGGVGGIITPILYVGSTIGSAASSLFGINPQTFSAIALVSLLAGITNAPIASSVMAIELFGPEIAPYACVSCLVSFLMTGHRSIYPSQVLSVRKSESVDVETGKTFGKIDPSCEIDQKKIQRKIKKRMKEIMHIENNK
ncbi:MAG TPA: chloride channel protein [Spirochaetota bacterium]|nr:chloride channel protein [Spirochaetota bacterium]HPM34593.1 chloride channel protein [Spirochaetota bacterium]